MRFKDVFAIIGPSMIGPSSSHTAGAVRIGRAARQALGGPPLEAEIALYGSFAETYRGHGTDVALLAGLLGFDTDDERIRDAYAHAARAGLYARIAPERKPAPHPNTAALRLRGAQGEISVTGCSIGGGSIEIVGVDGFETKLAATQPTLLVFHADAPGIVARLAAILYEARVNIGRMEVGRQSRNGAALTAIECDQRPEAPALAAIGRTEGVSRVRTIDLAKKEGESGCDSPA